MGTVFSTITDVLKFIALIVGFFGGLPKLIESFISPNLKVEGFSIDRYEAGAEIIDSSIVAGPPTTILKWKIKNSKRFLVFGSNALDVEIHWNVGIRGKEGEWLYRSEDPKKISFLALGQIWPQKTRINNYFPDEDYIIDFQMTSQGKVSGSARIEYPKEYFKRTEKA